ncbi:MAG: hypothetical protein RLZZ180_79 [Pseudomonadota bacterium]
MSQAQSRLKRAKAPSGGQRVQDGDERGGASMSQTQSRLKRANAPSGGSEYTPVTSVGVQA